MAVNKVILIGNVGNDPEIRHLEAGTPVANFRLATSETYTNRNGERITQTEWHNIVLWRGLAEVAEKYVKKGSQLYIEGRIRTRSWEDREGNKRFTTEIVADVMQLLGRKSDFQESSQSGETSKPSSEESSSSENDDIAPEPDDDLPF